MLIGIIAFLLVAILPPPLPLLIACFVFAFFLTRELFEGWAESLGHDPGRAQRRHTERMQRLQNNHERWQARHAARLTRVGSDRPTVGRAVQGRLARWIDGWGTRIDTIDDRNTADEQAGNEPGAWKAAFRRARQATSAMLRGWAAQAEERLGNRGRVINWTDDAAAIIETDADASLPAADLPPEPAGSDGPADGEPPRHRYWLDDYPGVCTKLVPNGQPGGAVACGNRYDLEPGQIDPHDCGDRHEGDPPLAVCAEDPSPAPASVPETSASTTPQGPLATVTPITRTTKQKEEGPMTDTLELASGQTITPEAGIKFTSSISGVLAEAEARVRNSIAAVSTARVEASQIADLQELANLLNAAHSKADAMTANFQAHQTARGAIEKTGAGTDANYLGRP